jgi:inositol transport system permease protein
MLARLKALDTGRYSIFLILAAVVIVASFLSENFMTTNNVTNVLRQVAVITILAYGAMTLIIGGMIDLSAGAVMAFAGVVSVIVYKDTDSMAMAILAGILVGVACNLVNAFLVATLRTPAFIVTLGMMMIARGAVLELTQGQNVLQLGDFVVLGQGSVGPLPLPTLFLIIITVIVWYLMTQTRYGR